MKQISGHIMALTCVLVWGSTFVVSKSLMEFLQPVQLMLLRFTLAYLALWAIKPQWYFKWKEEWRFILMAIFANSLYCLAENTALTLTMSTNVSIIVSASPLVTVVLMALLYKQFPTKSQVAGYLIAFTGVILVVLNGALSMQFKPAGDCLAFVAAVSWAIYGLLLNRWSSEYDSVLITRKLMFYGLISVLPAVLFGQHALPLDALCSTTSILKLLYLGLIGSCLCYLFWSRSVKIIGVVKANLYIYMVPIVTLIVSAIFLQEKITALGLIGIVMVISGMMFSTTSSTRDTTS